jgi:hypothetical protein
VNSEPEEPEKNLEELDSMTQDIPNTGDFAAFRHSTPIYIVAEILPNDSDDAESNSIKDDTPRSIVGLYSVRKTRESANRDASKFLDRLADEAAEEEKEEDEDFELSSDMIARSRNSEGLFEGSFSIPDTVPHFVKCFRCDVIGAVGQFVYFVCLETRKRGRPDKTQFADICGSQTLANEAAQAKLREYGGKRMGQGHRFGAFWGIRRIEDGTKVHVYVEVTQVR